jgi:hypothetical protein
MLRPFPGRVCDGRRRRESAKLEYNNFNRCGGMMPERCSPSFPAGVEFG